MRTTLLALLAALFVCSVHADTGGVGSFENEDALAWAKECATSKGTAEVKRALDVVQSSHSQPLR